jgi:hypothetical protein
MDARGSRTLGESAAALLTGLAVVVLFLVSGLMLQAMGIAYDTAGGASR